MERLVPVPVSGYSCPSNLLFQSSVILSEDEAKCSLSPGRLARAQSKDLAAFAGDNRNGFELLQEKAAGLG
jgi:hypothetical protein